LSLSPRETGVVTGFSLVLLAAVMNGAYAIPMRFMPRWKWENIWLVWTVLSLWVIPVATAWAAVPRPIDAYSQTALASLLRIGLMGLLWGAGVLLLGMSFPLVGVAVGAAVGLGCAAAMGTLLPILYADTPLLQRSTGALVLVGVVMVLIGVGVCGFAGRARERHQGTGTMVTGHSIRGFLFASVGGTLTAALNLALAAGAPISAAVEQQHPSTSAASIAVWIPVLLAGGIPGVLYTFTLVARSHSAGLFRARGTGAYWPLVLMMGVLWLGSIVVYGNGVTEIGALGLVVGWPVFMSGAVIASAAWGALFGEWKNSGRTAKVSMVAGVFCLMIAITILGQASH
jgi:L-rhamnose-H+ transport protein